MRIFTILGILFYSVVLTIIGITMIAFSLNILHLDRIIDFLSLVALNMDSRVIFGLSGLLLILVCLSFAQLIIGRLQREKTIAFTTQSGQVTISLSAVEDLIRRLSVFLPEIKELRPDVIATKKGSLIVDLRVILKSEANIPDLTQRLQDMTKAKLQEVLGIEEEIVTKIHIAKIISVEEKRRRDADKEPTIVPFSTYNSR
ncbi:MAG: alkaline shock response membrane anchor protein AmaP [Candidatus Omnitrophota bacterium]|jgi:hypothetical protein|nr:MAG: alkaline shock response membrane anchor protein AmaP [Candidatus Omnitrophota bacterium]